MLTVSAAGNTGAYLGGEEHRLSWVYIHHSDIVSTADEFGDSG